MMQTMSDHGVGHCEQIQKRPDIRATFLGQEIQQLAP